MKKILFIYSLVVTLGLSFFFAFNSPSRTTLILSLLMLPIPAYFLIALTNPKEVGVPKWSLRILIIVFLLSILSLIALKLLNIGISGALPQTKETSTQTPIATSKPQVTPKIKGSDEFTDILIEESSGSADDTRIIE